MQSTNKTPPPVPTSGTGSSADVSGTQAKNFFGRMWQIIGGEHTSTSAKIGRAVGMVFASLFTGFIALGVVALKAFYQGRISHFTDNTIAPKPAEQKLSGVFPSAVGQEAFLPPREQPALSAPSTPVLTPLPSLPEARPLFIPVGEGKEITSAEVSEWNRSPSKWGDFHELCEFIEISSKTSASEEISLRGIYVSNGLYVHGMNLRIPDSLKSLSLEELNMKFLSLMLWKSFPRSSENTEKFSGYVRLLLKNVDVPHRLAFIEYLGRSLPVVAQWLDHTMQNSDQQLVGLRINDILDDLATSLQEQNVKPEQLTSENPLLQKLREKLMLKQPQLPSVPNLSAARRESAPIPMTSPTSQHVASSPHMPSQYPICMKDEDRDLFDGLGIHLNKDGSVRDVPSSYRFTQTKGGDNWHVEIFLGEKKIVSLNTKTTASENYNRVCWEPKN
jgi:hypothetical protein